MTNKPDAIVVIGVARTGTSCVSGMLERLGVNFDDGHLLKPTTYNPKGYFESQSLNDLLDTQIRAFRYVNREGYQSNDTPISPPLAEYLDKRLECERVIGMKDTRLVSCGVPVVKYLHDAGANVRVITTRRSINANIKSLESWHNAAQAQALSAMLNRHLRRTEREIKRSGVPVFRVNYEHVTQHPYKVATALAGFSGVQVPASVIEHATEFVDKTLDHHGRKVTR
jgi:hypothetical protein